MDVQVEYYFSDENLPKDKFLLKYVKKDKGFGQCSESIVVNTDLNIFLSVLFKITVSIHEW